MKLITDWKRIWYRLWSIRLALLTAVLSAVEIGFEYYANGHASWIVFGISMSSLATAVSRVVSQDNLYDDYFTAP